MGKRIGITLYHQVYPWARSQALVENGSADAFATIPNKNRKKYTRKSEIPFFISNFLMYSGWSNPKLAQLKQIDTLSDLITRSHIIHGYIVGGGWHGVHLKEAKLKKVASPLQVLK